MLRVCCGRPAHEEDVQAPGAHVQRVGDRAFHRLVAVGFAEGVPHDRVVAFERYFQREVGQSIGRLLQELARGG